MTEAQSVPQPHSDMRARAPQRPFTWPLAVQAAAYVVLIALACLPGSGAVSSSTFSVTAFAVAAIIVLFAFFCPLRDGVPGRVTAVVLGFVAMVCASTPLLGQFVFERQGAPHAGAANAQYTSAAAWCAGVAGLLVVLVVAAFIRQMARPQRTDMIVQLAHMVTDGVVSIAASGWCFLPMLFHEAGAADVWRIVCVVVVVAGAVALAVVSRLWHREAQPLPGVRAAWVGFGLLPVMLTGALVGIAALIMWLV